MAAEVAAATVDPLQAALVGHLYVFVYGTLRAGGSNDITRYCPPPQWIGRAAVAGTLYDFGGWPGLRLAGEAKVVGEVWRIDLSVVPLLDQLEGVREDGSGEYLKRCLSLVVGSQPVECLVYVINPDRLAGRPIVPSGDWIVHRALRTSPSPAAHKI